MIEIRDYRPEDERAWLECRLLSFFYSSYYDDVQREKNTFENAVIDLVAECEGRIVGFIEVECENEDSIVCEEGIRPAGMIWNIGVLSEYRRQGIAGQLLNEAIERARTTGIARFEAYTRDDPGVLEWYERKGFRLVMSYLHVYMNHFELTDTIGKEVERMIPIQMMAHYTGGDQETILSRFKRVHRCHRLQLLLHETDSRLRKGLANYHDISNGESSSGQWEE